jgi:hypothetical protein
MRRETFQGSMRRLSNIGFKILLDIIASSPRPLQVKEIPFYFRERHAGESKFDALIGWEYLMLLADKVVGHIVPIRFILFALICPPSYIPAGSRESRRLVAALTPKLSLGTSLATSRCPVRKNRTLSQVWPADDRARCRSTGSGAPPKNRTSSSSL